MSSDSKIEEEIQKKIDGSVASYVDILKKNDDFSIDPRDSFYFGDIEDITEDNVKALHSTFHLRHNRYMNILLSGDTDRNFILIPDFDDELEGRDIKSQIYLESKISTAINHKESGDVLPIIKEIPFLKEERDLDKDTAKSEGFKGLSNYYSKEKHTAFEQAKNYFNNFTSEINSLYEAAKGKEDTHGHSDKELEEYKAHRELLAKHFGIVDGMNTTVIPLLMIQNNQEKIAELLVQTKTVEQTDASKVSFGALLKGIQALPFDHANEFEEITNLRLASAQTAIDNVIKDTGLEKDFGLTDETENDNDKDKTQEIETETPQEINPHALFELKTLLNQQANSKTQPYIGVNKLVIKGKAPEYEEAFIEQLHDVEEHVLKMFKPDKMGRYFDGGQLDAKRNFLIAAGYDVTKIDFSDEPESYMEETGKALRALIEGLSDANKEAYATKLKELGVSDADMAKAEKQRSALRGQFENIVKIYDKFGELTPAMRKNLVAKINIVHNKSLEKYNLGNASNDLGAYSNLALNEKKSQFSEDSLGLTNKTKVAATIPKTDPALTQKNGLES